LTGSNDARWRVFLSHTSELRNFPDKGSYAAEAERAISAAGHVIVDMADFPAIDQPAAQLCAERVRSCDVYIGVLGTRYGSPVRDAPDVSYTELEFDTATAAGLPRLVFLLDTAATDAGIPLSELIDHKFGAQQEAFRRRVQGSGLVTQSFANPDQLGKLVERSLRELAEVRQASGPLPPGSVLRIWSIPARNPGFLGRDRTLAVMRERLSAKEKAVAQILQGMGGVGKTQLAIEYAHRFAASYDVAWWVNAEQADLIGDQFVSLGAALGCVQPGADTEAVRVAVLTELRQRERWLIVFDNAERPTDVAAWLPNGGHVLITSRQRVWAEIGSSVEVDVLARTESVAILQSRVTGLQAADADQLADQLGDLPLAVAQAAGFMAETGVHAAQYLDLLRTQAGKLLDKAAPGSFYPRSLAAATRLTAEGLDSDDPAAAQLASLCAFLAPEPIPEDLFSSAPGELPAELAALAADPLTWPSVLAQLTRRSLARVDQRGLQMHRLTQAILRDRLTSEQAVTVRARTDAILAASNPGAPRDPATWSRWAQLMPHFLAADLAATGNPGLRQLACDACSYLLMRGDLQPSYKLARDLFQQWRVRLGGDHEHVVAIARYLAWALWAIGRRVEARNLAQDSLDRRRRLLGEDAPDTLTSASNLAVYLFDLGEVEAARDLDQDTMERRRRILGEDHPDTLGAANNLAVVLSALGEVAAAQDLDQDTLERRRRVLGENHPDTLTSASNLAVCLNRLGEVEAARDLNQDTLERRRRVLGENHPDTLTSASNLARDLRVLGEDRRNGS
jgi:Domain of unknown function (DUF4062)/Tetratricopeptide repeat/NB-ARC domain